MSQSDLNIAVVIPCYRVKSHIKGVLEGLPPLITSIFVVDDKCPDGSGKIAEGVQDPRLQVIFRDQNGGVGAAVCTGYRAALAAGADIIIKMDGDGQMDPGQLPHLLRPILNGEADYTKGNRFYRPEDLRGMPPVRIFGNSVLSLLTKLSSGYWNIFDPTNGYTAIHQTVLEQLPLDKLSPRYFFESDMLFRLGALRAVVVDVPMTSRYGEEKSNLKIGQLIGPFLAGHGRNLIKRLIYSYLLRDFNAGTIELLIGLPAMLFGVVFGLSQWSASTESGIPTAAGTVMIAALPIIFGTQLLIGFLNYDVNNTPKRPLHCSLAK